jgi:hypothetical protein
MAKNILGPDSVILASEIQKRLATGYLPFFRMFSSEDILSSMPLGKSSLDAMDKVRAAIRQIKAVYGGQTIPSKSSISRLNTTLTEIDKAKADILRDELAKTIITAKSRSLPLPLEDINYNIQLRPDSKESSKNKGLLSQTLGAMGLSGRSAIGLGLASQLAAPALGPFFGTVVAGLGAARLLAKPTMWAGKILGKGVGALAGVSLRNNRGMRRGGGMSGVGSGLESFMGGKGFDPQAPMSGLGQPTVSTPPAPPAASTDLSAAGRTLAMARWGKKDTGTGQPTSFEFSKNLEHFFDKRAYKAKWTRDVAGYLKTMSGGKAAGIGIGGGGLLETVKNLIQNPMEALGLVSLMKSFNDLLPILGTLGKALGLVGAIAFTTYELWQAAKAGKELHKSRTEMKLQYGENISSFNQHMGEVKRMGLETYAQKLNKTPEEAMRGLVTWKQSLDETKGRGDMGALGYIPGVNKLIPWLNKKQVDNKTTEDEIRRILSSKGPTAEWSPSPPDKGGSKGNLSNWDAAGKALSEFNEEHKQLLQNNNTALQEIKKAIEESKPAPLPGPRLPNPNIYDSADPLLNLLNYHGAWPLG